MTFFLLHSSLARKIWVADLPLCSLLLENEAHYPWLILVPRRPNVSRIMDLSWEDQIQLLKEMDATQEILWGEYRPAQINVAAIGNKTPQLHVHAIARFLDDPAWPGTVWDHPVRKPLAEEEKQARVARLRELFLVIQEPLFSK